LVVTAILDRCGTWRSNPVLSAIQRYLVEKALGRWLDYQSLAWSRKATSWGSTLTAAI